jgi:hypothetical protein
MKLYCIRYLIDLLTYKILIYFCITFVKYVMVHSLWAGRMEYLLKRRGLLFCCCLMTLDDMYLKTYSDHQMSRKESQFFLSTREE